MFILNFPALDKRNQITDHEYSEKFFMDPKSLSNLDPKLRETYERVMGSASSTQAPPAPAQPSVAPPPTVEPVAPATPSPAAPPIPTPSATTVVDSSVGVSPAPETPPMGNSPFQTPVVPINEPAPLPSPAAVNQNVEGTGASSLVKILYIAGAIVFFAVYTYFWMRVFNLQLPF